eukprot:TRINITY_DN10879_c0_g1_i1.p1 TRINITY_DN10879_c0_g1~~TRINITY_DN10879_c0_g1_i1.p1  ORF type:complete len:328 (-),score=67.71 TRINITY_DN10879_c0_g1_i1:54-1037(-)
MTSKQRDLISYFSPKKVKIALDDANTIAVDVLPSSPQSATLLSPSPKKTYSRRRRNPEDQNESPMKPMNLKLDFEDDVFVATFDSLIKEDVLSPKKRKAEPSNQPSMEQTFLDFGQKNLGSITCPDCGMMYSAGIDADDQEHAKYHKKMMKTPLSFPGWKNERIIKKFDATKEHISMFVHGDPAQQVKKMETIVQYVTNELGFSEAQGSRSTNRQKVFVYIANKKCIACLVAEPIETANPIIPKKDPSEPISCSRLSMPASIGVSRIWVHQDHRRKGTATRLLNVAREHFVFGTKVSIMEVACTQPTEMGLTFFTKYCQRPDFLVYY